MRNSTVLKEDDNLEQDSHLHRRRRSREARQARFDELRATAEDKSKHKEFLLRTSLIASVRKAQSMP